MFSCLGLFADPKPKNRFFIPVSYHLRFVWVKGEAKVDFATPKVMTDLGIQFRYKGIPEDQIHAQEADAFKTAKKLYPNNNFYILTLIIPDYFVGDICLANLKKHLVYVRSFQENDSYVVASEKNDRHKFSFDRNEFKIPEEHEMLQINKQRQAEEKIEEENTRAERAKQKKLFLENEVLKREQKHQASRQRKYERRLQLHNSSNPLQNTSGARYVVGLSDNDTPEIHIADENTLNRPTEYSL